MALTRLKVRCRSRVAVRSYLPLPWLRESHGRVNYRLLYFFHGKNVAILAHALTKEDVVPPRDIERALERKQAFEADPAKHTYTE